ncbi:MAG: M14 metallopeptidase family protein [Maribacter sp.]
MDFRAIDYKQFYVPYVKGRYITNTHLGEFLSHLPTEFEIQDMGTSVQNRTIKSVIFGKGPKRILMWSQMHGNESTTTKALLDVLHFLKNSEYSNAEISNAITLKVIPILNPDGAQAYTRVNANEIDLNRDAQDLSQPESRILKQVYEGFKPHFCFNLHDQRTIFNVGETPMPATVSFLAPAFDNARNVSPSRKTSMQLIAAMNQRLQKMIPGQVGRYDDAFNANCVGDAFQILKTPTVLVEAGHYPNDYERERTREFIFHALIAGLYSIVDEKYLTFPVDDYLQIPENGKQFYDILLHNAQLISNILEVPQILPIQYKEMLTDGEIKFIPEVMLTEVSSSTTYGHKSLDCSNASDVQWLKDNDFMKLFS